MQARSLTRSASDLEFKKSGVDWSETYLENDQLDSQLESTIHQIRKAKYKATIDSDYNLMEARRQAEEIQQLSNAIKKKDRPNSVKLYECRNKSFSKSRANSAVQLMNETIAEKEEAAEQESEMTELRPEYPDSVSTEKEHGNGEGVHVDTRSEEGEGEIKLRPINVAMFKLSLRSFNHNRRRESSAHEIHRQSMSIPNIRQTQSAAPSNIRDRPRNIRDMKRSSVRSRRPATSKLRQLKDGEVLEAVDIHPVVILGINTRKMKDTKSRRELEEMSKIQREEKFGSPDKEKAERKSKMIAWAKGDGTLDNKIRHFIADIEDFKRRSIGSDNPLFYYRRAKSVLLA